MVQTFGFATEHPEMVRSAAPAALLHHLGHPVLFTDQVRQTPMGTLACQLPLPDDYDLAKMGGFPMAIADVIVLVGDYVDHVGRRAIREARKAGQIVIADVERKPIDALTRGRRSTAASACDLIVVGSDEVATWIGAGERTVVVPTWTEGVDTDWSAVLKRMPTPTPQR